MLLPYTLSEVTWAHQMTAERIISSALLKQVNRRDTLYLLVTNSIFIKNRELYLNLSLFQPLCLGCKFS